MPIVTARVLFGSVAAAAVSMATAAHAGETHLLQADHVLGTSFEMAVAGVSEAQAQFAFAAARAEIDRLDAILSAWRADSELSRLNAMDRAVVSPDLFAVLSKCEVWTEKTDGAFNAKLGKVEEALRAGETSPEVLCALAEGAQAVPAFDAIAREVERPEGTAFAPDGLAKGYVIDAALSAARRAAPGATGVMVNIGGDLACFGTDGDGQAWKAAIANPADLSDNADPVAYVSLFDTALAVSGAGARDLMIDGQAQSHILNAKTGRPAARTQVAVTARRAADADAASTALAALPPAHALALAERLPGVEAAIWAGADRLETSGWAKASTAVCQAPLPAGYAVEVSYEIPKINVGNYKKPYLIVWVTDAEKNLVKNLLIMGDRKDWQESNNVWWRRYGRKAPEVLTKASPTKAPGRYNVVWDGTDADGKRVAQGAYTIHVEAAREHGGHAYQSVDVNLGAAGVTAAMSGKDELGAANVRYFRR